MFGTAKLDAFTACKKLDEPIYRFPKSIQESIPVSRISERGVFEIEDLAGNRTYDRLYLFEDVNFVDKDEEGKREVFRSYCEFLNSMQTNFKVQIFNFNEDMERFRELIFLKHQEGEDECRRKLVDGFNKDILERNMLEGANGITQVRFLVISCKKESFEEANAFFDSVDVSLQTHFSSLESKLTALNAEQRLRYLFYVYRMGHESDYDLSWSALLTRHDWKNDIAGDEIVRKKRSLEFEDKFVSMLYVQRFGSKIPDDFLTQLTNVPYNVAVTLDSVPIPTEIAVRAVQSIAMGIEESIQKQQELRNKAGAFSSDISWKKRTEKKEIEQYMDNMHNNDANLFWTNVLVMVVGKTQEEMESNVRNLQSIASQKGFRLSPCVKKQLEAFNSALPIGGRYVDYTRPLFTQPLAGFVPFNTQVICHAGGVSYGINQVNKKLLVVNRKQLTNGNGFVFGVPGSGKSFYTKMEMAQVYASTKDDMIVIDPQNEYFDIASKWGGNVIDFSVRADLHMNPFELPPIENKSDFSVFVGNQAEFAISLVHSMMATAMTPYHNSVVEKAIREMYSAVKDSWQSPTMMDFKVALEKQTEKWKEPAEDVLLAIEPFTAGSLNIFAQESNVDMGNRFTVFGLGQLQENLRKPAMLVMINFINQRVLYNASEKKATWLWCDEFHMVVQDELQAKEMEKCFKIFRKMGGLVTGITQNLDDMVRLKTTRTMVSNCEFLALLKQANLDRSLIDSVIEISNAQTKYVTNVESGTGLLRLGEKIVPFNNQMPKSCHLYDLFNTNLHEKAKQKQGGKKECME